jgi:hypothetical protein
MYNALQQDSVNLDRFYRHKTFLEYMRVVLGTCLELFLASEGTRVGRAQMRSKRNRHSYNPVRQCKTLYTRIHSIWTDFIDTKHSSKYMRVALGTGLELFLAYEGTRVGLAQMRSKRNRHSYRPVRQIKCSTIGFTQFGRILSTQYIPRIHARSSRD